MAQPYVGEIRIFAGNFAPAGWLFCEGQTLPISENEVLFQLIGTTYGGDGQSTFNLPDLASRIPVHMGTGPDGTNHQIGEMAGTESETLTVQQMPAHNHAMSANDSPGSLQAPTGGVPARATGNQPGLVMYGSDSVAQMNAAAGGSAGGSQPHGNCQPFLCLNYIISLYGVFPSQT